MYWQRGKLTPEQVQLVIRNLPLDISFADENDVLVFWNGPTYKTCDGRYVGRDVRDCHPEPSLEALEDILAQFKAGTQDVAEGWELDGERFKYTRYTAVRDDAGAYKGILEVNHDVTGVRALEGAQTLPGW
ncbi:MAG TPA: PAS domain-containing protein [Thermoleophilia bacterium]|nr:PAS domain-containing protein [Thermoleophilia bacterium]